MFFIVLEIPLRSIDVEIELTTEKQKQIFIIGDIATTIKPSITDKKSIIDAFETAALVIEPFIMYKALITGAKEFIVEHRVLRYSTHISHKVEITLNALIATQIDEHIENAFFNPSDANEAFIILKMEIIISNAKKEDRVDTTCGSDESK